MSTTSEHIASIKASKTAVTLQSRRSLYVGGLEESVNETILRAAMIPFGNIKSLEIPKDYQKGTNRGFGFVEYEDAEDAAEAIFNMNGAELLGRVLTVNIAQPTNHKLGSNKAVWSSDDWFQEQAGGGESKEEREKKEIQKEDVAALKEKSPIQISH